MALIEGQRRTPAVPFVRPNARAETHSVAVDETMAGLCRLADLQGLMLHILRHSFASITACLGYSELKITSLLGHASLGVTQRYVHFDKPWLSPQTARAPTA